MIVAVSTTCLLCFFVVWWPTFAGGVSLTCHCATSAVCSNDGYCPNGCEKGWYGPGCQIGNLAFRKSAWQSTTFTGDPGIDNGAYMAVDGITPNNNSATQCSHTAPYDATGPTDATEAWWYVELDSKDDFVIQNVTILNRNHSDLAPRLSNFSIVYTTSLANSPPDFTNWQSCIYVRQHQRNTSHNYACQTEAVAKRVGVRLRNSTSRNILTLCEVIVNGYRKYDCPIGYSGPGCLLRNCTSVACTDNCNYTNGCYYLTCPEASVLQPNCWIKLPSLRHLNITTAVTCGSITVIVDGRLSMDEVNHGNFSMRLELKYENDVSIYPLYAYNNFVTFNLTMPAIAGELYRYRIVMQWCSSNQISCIFGNSSWMNATTERRPCNRSLPCHCAGSQECRENGYCPAGCGSGWFGPGCQVGNLALKKPANQSSLYAEDKDVDNSAAMAVDGRNQSNERNAEYCTHTNPRNDGYAWWYVELDRNQDIVIQDVTIINRRQAPQRLANFSIVYTSTIESQQPDSNWSICYYSVGPQVQNIHKYSCLSNAIGRKLGVLLRNNADENKSILTLCEVIVDGYYKFKCKDGFTGPGCLLHECKTTDCSGGCDDFGGCKYSTCPDSAFLPPDCWIRLPSLRKLVIGHTATCNSINVRFDIKEVEGDLSLSSVIFEVTSESDSRNVTHHVSAKSAFVNVSVFATTGTTYRLRLIPRWCREGNGTCFSGPSSNWTSITTGGRNDLFTKNDSCFHVKMSSSTANCEQLTLQITCRDHFNEYLNYTSNQDTLCQLPIGVYRCSVIGNLNGIAAYSKTVDAYIGLTKVDFDEKSSSAAVLTVGILSGVLLFGIVVTVLIIVVRRKLKDTNDRSVKKHENDVKNEDIDCHEQYAALSTNTGSGVAEEYATLNFSSELHDLKSDNS